MTTEEAYERLKVRHSPPPSRAEIEALAAQLPVRTRRHKVSESAAHDIASPDSADAGVRLSEQQERRQRIVRALDEILAELPAEDAAILALHFKGGKRWSEIAVITGLPQRSLYPRRDALLKRMGEELQRRGISRAEVMEFLKEDV
jgi:DNA-directed RNA polymerase specialized sigma24 family protein